MKPPIDVEEGANSISVALNTLGYLAAPRLLARDATRGSDLRASLVPAIDWLEQIRTSLGDTNQETRDLLTAEPQLRAICALLDDAPPSAACTDLARACLAAQGYPEPPGGWDAFGGHETK